MPPIKPRKFRNKYRVDTTRKTNWDYRRPGAYFITICTKNRVHCFGKIVKKHPLFDAEMQLSELGKLAEKFWIEIPLHFPFVDLGNFVIMPDHLHGMLIIKNISDTLSIRIPSNKETFPSNSNVLDINIVNNEGPFQKINACPRKAFMSSISPKYGSISSIIRSYKSAVSKYAHKIDAEFSWQSNYHDYVVLTKKAFDNMQEYTRNNPQNWKKKSVRQIPRSG